MKVSLPHYKRLKEDPKFKSLTVARFINYIMKDGKKKIARKIVYGSFEEVKEKTKKEPLAIFETAIKNTAPFVEVKSKRIGGANYQVPMEVGKERRVTLAMRWIIAAARSKKGKTMQENLAREILEASKKEGAAVKKKEDTHRMAEANKAFAHFARF